jgi:hypothetical protein
MEQSIKPFDSHLFLGSTLMANRYIDYINAQQNIKLPHVEDSGFAPPNNPTGSFNNCDQAIKRFRDKQVY